MTQFGNARFSVYAPGTDNYRSNWDRIFAPESEKLQKAVLEQAEREYTDYGHVICWPESFLNLGKRDDIVAALNALAVAGKFTIDYKLCCIDGHVFSAGSEFPVVGGICRVCDKTIDLDNDLSFIVDTRYIWR